MTIWVKALDPSKSMALEGLFPARGDLTQWAKGGLKNMNKQKDLDDQPCEQVSQIVSRDRNQGPLS